MERICNICGNCKKEIIENFRQCKYSNGIAYFKSICKVCEKIKNRQYAREHKNKRKEYSKKFRQSNPLYIKNWKKINKLKINEQEKLRRKQDISFKLKKNVSRAIARAITKSGNSTIKYLPYTIEEFKFHLQLQFDDKMTWNNYGIYWHIDHIIPQSMFSYQSMEDVEFIECWKLTNLRPLEANQNRLDGSTRIRHKR